MCIKVVLLYLVNIYFDHINRLRDMITPPLLLDVGLLLCGLLILNFLMSSLRLTLINLSTKK